MTSQQEDNSDPLHTADGRTLLGVLVQDETGQRHFRSCRHLKIPDDDAKRLAQTPVTYWQQDPHHPNLNYANIWAVTKALPPSLYRA